MENAPIKRGRGRPRKSPVVVPEPVFEDDAPAAPDFGAEEVFHSSQRVDLSDLASATPSVHFREPEEEEVIHLGHRPEPDATQEAAPPSPPTAYPRASQDVLEMLRASAPAPAPAMPPVQIVDDKAKRRELITKVKNYRESFPAVAAMRFSEDWDTEAIESHLQDIRVAVSAKTTGLLVKSAYLAGVKGVEIGGCAVGLKVYGLADILARSAEVDSCLRQIQCELPVLGHIGPGHRLALATFGAALALDSANRKSEALGQFKAAPVGEAVSSKYGDL